MSSGTRTYIYIHTIYLTPRQSRSREVLSPDLVIIAAADLPADLVRTAERGRAGDRRGSIDRSIDRDDRTPRKQRASERITESTGRASLDSRSVLLARTGESTTWEYTSPRITPPLRLARNTHTHTRTWRCTASRASVCEEATGKYSL